MLIDLSIKDFTITEQINLEFKRGLISITGETGAGKSIILGAIGLIIGNKVKKDIVRKGCEKAIITATFNISGLSNVQNKLEENDTVLEDNTECIIRRVIRASGQNRCFINDSPVSLPKLKEIGDMLVEIHGQHQHQFLSKEKKQLELLDNFLNLKDLKDLVGEKHKKWKEKLKKQKEIENNFEESNNKFQLLSYQLKELKTLDLQEYEFEELEKDAQMLESASNVIEVCQDACEKIDNNENNSILNNLSTIIRNIEYLNDEKTKDIIDLLTEAKINIEETLFLFKSYENKFEINPEKLLSVTERIKTINHISDRMYTVPEKLLELKNSLEIEIEKLNYSEDAVEEAKKESDSAFEDYKVIAIKLSKARTENSHNMEDAINKEAVKLNLAENIFKVKFLDNYKSLNIENKKILYSNTGIDKIDFYIRPNLGQDYQSLKEIASGGELSRLSLAIQVVSLKNEKIPTMIFDEVDTGLSGETGNVVGAMLRNIGEAGQVICVTHLPQVAAQGHSHFKVLKKNITKETGIITISSILKLENKAREQEIARMIGGDKLSTESLNNAKKMIETFNLI